MALRNREVKVERNVVPVVEQVAVGMNDRDVLIWSLYTMDGKPDDMGFSSQIAYGVRSLLRYPTAGVLAMATECRPDCDHARQALEAMASRVLPAALADN